MDSWRIAFSIFIIILSLSLPSFHEKISFRTIKSTSIKGRWYLVMIFSIIYLSVDNIYLDTIKSEKSEKTQSDTKSNTDTIINKADIILTKIENSLNKIEIVSNRLEKLSPRLDSLETRTIKSINKIDTALSLFDRYDSLQKLKFLENEPKIIIDSIAYYFDKKFNCYFINIEYLNIGGRNASKVKLNIHFFYIDTIKHHIISDRNLTTSDIVNEDYVVSFRSGSDPYHFTLSNGCYKKPRDGFLQIIITYYDELLKKSYSVRERYEWQNYIQYGFTFSGIIRENNKILEDYIKINNLTF